MGKQIDAKLNFTPLRKVIERKQRSARFRKALSEETGRLELAHELRILRKRRSMTQGQVAAQAQMPQSVVARIESGTHSFSIATLHRIARVFDRKIGLVR